MQNNHKRLLVDISHPAHVHFFKFAIQIWRQHGHEVLIVARDKDIALALLNEYQYEYECVSRAKNGLFGLAIEMIQHEAHLFRIAQKFEPHVMVQISGTFIVHVGLLLGIETIVFSDTEHAKLSNTITYPFATKICVPDCYQNFLGQKEVRYAGYHELAYLHPNRFSPNKAVLDELGLCANDPFYVIRFVSWGAAHDVGQFGFSPEGKYQLVKCLSQFGQVIITSESRLPSELKPYQMRVSPTKIHDLLAFSSLYIGESATMASESAILGTPFIFVSPAGRGYTDEQEKKYGLGYTLGPDQEARAIELALELVEREKLHEEWQGKRKRLLEDKIDVTAWMVDFVEQYITEKQKAK